jgi:serine/threonine protein kinase
MREAWSIVYQLSAALAYCHHGIIRTQSGSILREEKDREENVWVPVLHRDIKPENGKFSEPVTFACVTSYFCSGFGLIVAPVLVRYNLAGQAVVKLCDFGLSHTVRSLEDAQQLTWGGTLPYLAPVRSPGLVSRNLAKARCRKSPKTTLLGVRRPIYSPSDVRISAFQTSRYEADRDRYILLPIQTAAPL